MNLQDLGWDDGFAASFEPHERLHVRRHASAAQHRGGYDVLTEAGELRVSITGRLRHEAASGAELPAVGDWVALRDEAIQAVLPRRSAFSRKAAWASTEEQVLAANLDTVFVVSALDGDLNLRRLERYLTLAWESGATPVLVLTKADLCDDVGAACSRSSRLPWASRPTRSATSAASRARRARLVSRAGADGRAARLVRSRQVDARQPAARRGARR